MDDFGKKMDKSGCKWIKCVVQYKRKKGVFYVFWYLFSPT